MNVLCCNVHQTAVTPAEVVNIGHAGSDTNTRDNHRVCMYLLGQAR